MWQLCELLYTCYLLTYLPRVQMYTVQTDRTVIERFQTATKTYSIEVLSHVRRQRNLSHWRRVVRHARARYDTRCYFNVRSKADMSQLNLPHENRQLKSAKQKNQKVKTNMLRSNTKQSETCSRDATRRSLMYSD